MDIFTNINYLAVIVSLIIFYVIGYFWYTEKLFGGVWVKERGYKTEKTSGGTMVYSYIGMLITEFLYVMGIAIFLNLEGVTGFGGSIIAWLLIIILFVLPIHSGTLFFPPKPKLFFIDWGYYVVGTLISAIILGLWR